MSRWLLLIALLAGVTIADARPKKAKVTARATSKKKKKRKKEPKVPRIPDKTTDFKTNMPRGWQWPPSKTMQDAEAICEGQLDGLGITWERAKPEGRIVDPITIPAMELGGITYTSMWRKGPQKMDCQFARTMATFGAELYALGVREIKFGSIYRYTTVRVGGKSKNILSRHALGIAMDVVSFVDEAGRVAVVGTDYIKDDPLLLAIEQAINNSGRFRTVLTPRNDPLSHKDHFHIEAAVDYSAAERP